MDPSKNLRKRITSKALCASVSVLSLASLNAFAVGISNEKYQQLAGTLSKDGEVVRRVFGQLTQESLQSHYDAVGRLIAGNSLCTATWLGNEGNKAVILTAAHCVSGSNRSQESIHTGQRISFRTGDNRLIASGKAETHFAGYRGCSSDIAIIKAPLITSPINAKGKPVPQPIIADDPTFDSHVGKPMNLAGYGLWGTRSLKQVGSGRAYGMGQVSRDVNGCLRSIAEQRSDTRWAHGTPGDSGSLGWQLRDGQFVGVAVTSWWTGWSGKQSGHGRVALHHEWMEKTYPQISTVTKTRTITEDNRVILTDLEQHIKGSIYYLAGTGVSGPTSRKWAYPKGVTSLIVPMLNQDSGETHDIRLRAQRQTWCGWGEINNGAFCSPSATKGGLKVWFKTQDNSHIPAGRYQAEFSILAKGWHDKSYQSDLKLAADIEIGGTAELEGVITQSAPATTIRYDNTVKGSVYYLPDWNVKSDSASRRVWHGKLRTWTLLEVPVVDAETQTSSTVNLRASRYVGCGWSTMNNGVYCQNGAKYGQLKVSYNAKDNLELPNGHYEALFNIRARGWHSNFDKVLTFKVDIEKNN